MKIYLAARFSRRLELCGYRDEIEQIGHEVGSRWLNGKHAHLDSDWSQLQSETVAEWARDDMEDIEEAELLIFFSEQPGDGGRRGGRHVELGFALGCGIECMIVGPRENTFHCLSQIEVFPTFKECLDALIHLRSDELSLMENET